MANQEDADKKQRSSETITVSIVRGKNLVGYIITCIG